MRKLYALSIVCSLVLLPARGAAQAGPLLEPGDEVRITAPAAAPGVLQGELMSYAGDGLTIHVEETGCHYSIPFGSIGSVAENRGTNRMRSAWRLGRFTAFLGGGLGVIAGPFAAKSLPTGSGQTAMMAAAGGAVVAGGVGALVGALLAKDRWETYQLSPPSTGGSVPVRLCVPNR